MICPCGKEFHVARWQLESGRGKYCSNECKYKYRVRPSGLKYVIKAKNKGWFKSGDTRNVPSFPYFDKSLGYMKISIKGKEYKYHRYVLSVYLGRELDVDELVHHKDGNRLNNSLENLEIMSRSAHMKLHWAERRL